MFSPLVLLILSSFCFSICLSLRIKRQIVQSSFVCPSPNSFEAFWNVPLDKCNKHKSKFQSTITKYGIKHNKNLDFRGDQIVLLYDPGLFPIVKNNQIINEGIPQSGNFDQHIIKFREDINKSVPADFKGIGVIDFEVWRPVFQQNWKKQEVYKNMSIDLKNVSSLTDDDIKRLAAEDFEAGARKFMEETLKEVKILRPEGVWGYYGFPHCYNQYNLGFGECTNLAITGNNKTLWLFEQSTALYPSVYINESVTGTAVAAFVTARLKEAQRLWQLTRKESPLVPPYFWHKYKESTNFLTQDAVDSIMETIKHFNMGGVIIWASSDDFATDKDCSDYLDFVDKKLGPAIQKVQNLKVT